MKNTIEVWVIKDPKGNVWQTPKGKSSWASKVAAKKAWGCHNWGLRESKYGSFYKGNLVWSEDAEHLGWTVEQIAKYELVK